MPVQNQDAIRSEGLREFISYRPGVLIRRGIPAFFFVLITIAAGSWFIQYPDVVKAVAKINSINPPKPVVTKNGGRLIKLFKGDNWDVEKDDVIGYMESGASHDEVLKLASVLDTLQYFADSNRLEEIPGFWKLANHSFARLGELQSPQQVFMQAYITFKDYLSSGFYVTKKQMLNRDLINAKKILQTLQQQKELHQQELAITIENFNIHDTLHRETLINDIEYRNQKSQLIGKKMGVPQMNASIISNQNQQNALQKEMMEMDNQIAQQRALFIQSLNSYNSMVEEWKQKYILIAPVKGKLVYTSFLDENQLLQSGQVIAFIINDASRYYVEMLIPQTNFGKVKPGQDVLLKFPGYPSQEFGSVKGKIEYIKGLPVDSGYLARVSLPNGLLTNYKKKLFYREGLVAQAEIITDKKRLSDRFLSGFKDLIK